MASTVTAQWDAGGGGSITLVTDDVAQTLTQIIVQNGTVQMRAEVVIAGQTFGGIIAPGLNQTFTLPVPRPFTVTTTSKGDHGRDFGIDRITIAPA